MEESTGAGALSSVPPMPRRRAGILARDGRASSEAEEPKTAAEVTVVAEARTAVGPEGSNAKGFGPNGAFLSS